MRARVLLASGALLCAALVLTGSAGASYDPLASGSTRLTLDKSFAGLLAANGVKVVAKAGARRRGRALLLPVTGGRFDPTIERGEIESGGTLVFSRGRRRVVVRGVEVRTKREPLIARVGGSQLKVASAARVAFRRSGFGSSVVARRLRLTAKFATRLGKKLRLRGAFEDGQTLGSLRAEAQPLTLAVLPSGRVSFAPDPTFLAKLDGLFVSVNPVAPAERASGPVFTVPFAPAGTIAPDADAGVVRTGGGLEFLQLGSGQIFWQELWLDLAGHLALAEVDLEPAPTFPGKVGQVAVAALAGGSVFPDPAGRTVALDGGALSFTAAGAGQFNQAFAGGEETFRAGEPIGSVSLTARTQ